MFSAVIKEYFAEKDKEDGKKTMVVSVMPPEDSTRRRASGRAGGSRRIFPAPRSSRPLHPSARPSPPRSPPAPSPFRGVGVGVRPRGGVAAGGRGGGWGRRGTAPRPGTARPRTHLHRGAAPRAAPGRLGRPRRGRWPGRPPPRSPTDSAVVAGGTLAPR
jgi:hypothetical protein